MARDLSAYLQDIYDAYIAIEEVIEGVTLDDYRGKRAVRSSVEREFIIIGETLRRISALDERLFYSISNSRTIIDFRTFLPITMGQLIVASACLSKQKLLTYVDAAQDRSAAAKMPPRPPRR
jgi:hypothetical protein